MSTYYAVVTALIFAVVAVAHAIRLVNRWVVQVGPFSVPMSVSSIGLVIAADSLMGRGIGFLHAMPMTTVPPY